LCAVAGLILDPWQQLVVTHALGERADGKWAAREVGVCVPRQNGKGAIIEALELAGLFLLGERLIIHSAHLFDTSQEAMRRLLELIESAPDLESRVKRVVRSHGEEGIELTNGQRVRFRTRTKGGGRGLTGDRVILDEAMFLPEATMGALFPVMSARPNPQAVFLGSSVDQTVHEHGVSFARVRERGLAGADGLAYFEWGADLESPARLEDWMVEDEELWRAANPAFGIRIDREAVRAEVGSLSRRTFAVERLGVGDWPRTDGELDVVIPLAVWDALGDPGSKPLDPVWFAFDVAPDRSMSSIGVAGRRKDGRFHLEVVDRRPGAGWVASRVLELRERHSPAGIVCDGLGPAGSVMLELENARVQVTPVDSGKHAQACGMLFDLAHQDRVRHRGDVELRDALKGAAQRPLGDRWAWSRKSSTADISPLVAVTLALWGIGRQREPAKVWAASW
jgi:hypothetical protein